MLGEVSSGFAFRNDSWLLIGHYCHCKPVVNKLLAQHAYPKTYALIFDAARTLTPADSMERPLPHVCIAAHETERMSASTAGQ